MAYNEAVIIGTISYNPSGAAATGIGAGSYSGTISMGNASITAINVLGPTNINVTGSLNTAIGSTSNSGTVSIGNTSSTSVTIIGPTNINTTASNNTAINSTSSNGTVSIGNTSSGVITIDCGTAGIVVGTTANAHASTFGSTNSTSSTTIQSGSGALALTSTNGTWTGNSGTGALGLSTDGTNTTISLGTGAGVKAVTLGSTNSSSSTTINFGGSSGSALNTYISSTSWTPALKFGGAAVGITYSVQTGYYYRIGGIVFIDLEIVLTSKGSSTGTATITGLPVASGNVSGYSFALSWGTATNGITLAALNYMFVANVGQNSTTIALSSLSSGGQTALADTNFSNTSQFNLSGFYFST